MTGVVENDVRFGTKGSKVKITRSVTPTLVEAGKSKSIIVLFEVGEKVFCDIDNM